MKENFTHEMVDSIKAQLLNLKGCSTIELFEQGKKIHEQTDNNMITNWVSSLLNLPSSLWAYNSASFSNYLNSMMPIVTTLMGGVLLWDNEITEDVDMFYPPSGVGCVGYAGAGYSGANPYRGSYNTPESGIITNGYRHVWDFATNQSNGTIKALSLTSKKGGNKGWKYYSTETDGADTYLYQYVGISLRSINEGTGCDGYPILTDFSSDKIRVYSLLSGILSRYDLPSMGAIAVLDGRTGTNAVSKTSLATVENRNHMYWYDNKFHQVWTSSTTQIRHKSWDITGTLVDDKTIDISGVVSIASLAYSSYAFYLNNSYFIRTSTGWAKLSNAGAYQSIVATTNSNGSYLTQIGGLVYDNKSGRAMLANNLEYNSNGQLHILDSTGFTCFNNTGSQYNSSCSCRQLPWLQCGGNTAAASNNYPFDIFPYSFGLASINNLATPIVKTSTQTMKITYEITQEVT